MPLGYCHKLAQRCQLWRALINTGDVEANIDGSMCECVFVIGIGVSGKMLND
jgi:hypothetical protein